MEAARSPLSSFAARLVATATVVALMLAATFQLWPRVSFWQQQRLATRLIAELEHTASPQIHTTLKQITSLGNPAIEPLVIAAASERADIALAARRIIEEQLATWKIRAGSQEQFSLSEPTSLLAAALAKHIAELGPFGQQWATRITLDLVDIAGGIPTKAAVPILADCSVVLSATPALGPRMLTPEPPTSANDTEPIAVELPAVTIARATPRATRPPNQ